MRGRILAHRGFWSEPSKKNSVEAFERAFEQGFGIETDVRDLDGELVISHDPPLAEGRPTTLFSFLKLYNYAPSNPWLALNVKADGLASKVVAMLESHGVTNAFVFDMSVPDMRAYLRSGARVFTRRSDVEREPAYYEECDGVWLDCFDIPYSPAKWIIDATQDNKFAALVSPELHGRSRDQAWADWRQAVNFPIDQRVMICTDLPNEVLEYFRDKE